MDHFNATVQKDGALVSTRRGLQVTKTKYHGISFVNTSGPAQPSGGSVGTSGKKRGSKAGTTSTISFASTPSATTASSGFSAFSAFPPAAAPKSSNKDSNPAAPSSSSTSAPTQKAAASNTDPANPNKPLVHRWKLVTKPAAQKAKRESNASAFSTATGSQKQHQQQQQQQQFTPANNSGPDPAARRPSPTASGTAAASSAARITASTPAESASSFSSPLASPFLASPASITESIISASTGFESLSPLSTSTPTLDGMSLFAPQEWDADFALQTTMAAPPSTSTTISSYKQNRAAAAAAKHRQASHASALANESKARKARIHALANSCQQVARSLPTWTMCNVPQLNKFEQRLFHQFFQLIPRKLYPFEDLLQYNPTRSSEFYWMVVQDRAAVRCVLLCGAMLRAILGGANTSEELAQEVSNVCRIVNQQLALHQKEQKRAEREGSGSGSGSNNTSDDDEGNDKKMQLAAPFSTASPSPSSFSSPSPPASPQSTGSAGSTGFRRDRHAIPEMTLECITTLALMGGSTGRYDHWHLHMQALSKMVDLNGGRRFLTMVRPALLLKMRKTDLKGAMALAIRPYLPFDTRLFPNISDTVLLDVTRQDVLAAAAALFADPVCGLAPAVAATLGSLCVFVQAVQLAADLAKTATPLPLDPYCFSEEMYWLQQSLVSQPGPLRQDVAPQDAAAALDAETAALRHAPQPAQVVQPVQGGARPNTLLPVDTSRLQTESYVRNHRAPLAALYLIPAAPVAPSTCLEPAMRICGILYLKEFFPDFPRNVGGYAILLHILRSHLGSGVVGNVGNVDNGLFALSHAALLTNPHARALLLWICLVGDTVSRLANGNEERSIPSEQYDRRVFRDRLVDLVRTSGQVERGPSSSPMAVSPTGQDDGIDVVGGGVDGMDAVFAVDRLPESDWALCRLLDLGRIQQLGEWSSRQAVVNILLEGAEF
ncbi:hypothetical protein SCUCBS95973_003225 [Sporothrix curviconia]|uniref:Uncharacterized protein n=1 Tax=Sporothrix curviconia TaxID=1260050 RepID=A0ABP0BDE8_9PEZI